MTNAEFIELLKQDDPNAEVHVERYIGERRWIGVPRNATNGDMVLATGMFSVVKELNDGIMVYVKPKGVFGQVLEYTKDWWDTPYCKDGE